MNTVIAMLAGAALTGSVYMAGWGTCAGGGMTGAQCTDCAPVSRAAALTGGAAAIPDGYTDMKNTKCLVLAEDIGGAMGPGEIVTYEGKAYHVCCGSCVAEFKKDPEKYVMAFNADPAKFGVKN